MIGILGNNTNMQQSVKLRNIPIPFCHGRQAEPVDYAPLRDLKCGESLFFSGRKATSLASALHSIRSYSGRSFVSRSTEHDGQKGVMVWRKA